MTIKATFEPYGEFTVELDRDTSVRIDRHIAYENNATHDLRAIEAQLAKINGTPRVFFTTSRSATLNRVDYILRAIATTGEGGAWFVWWDGDPALTAKAREKAAVPSDAIKAWLVENIQTLRDAAAAELRANVRKSYRIARDNCDAILATIPEDEPTA